MFKSPYNLGSMRSHMPQLKIPRAATKPWCSRILIYLYIRKFLKKNDRGGIWTLDSSVQSTSMEGGSSLPPSPGVGVFRELWPNTGLRPSGFCFLLVPGLWCHTQGQARHTPRGQGDIQWAGETAHFSPTGWDSKHSQNPNWDWNPLSFHLNHTPGLRI